MSHRVAPVLTSGVPGFDTLVDGGLVPSRMYLLTGPPGAGKTTFALQFCREGVAQGERVLYVTLSQRAEELRQIAESHGWTLDGLDVLDAEADGIQIHHGEHSLFHTADIDLADVTDSILERVRETAPQRVVLDSAAEIRLLGGDALRSRRQVLRLKHELGEAGVTSLVIEVSGADDPSSLESVVHGVICLERHVPDYGPSYRRILVPKIRGVDNSTGYHDYRIRPGGVRVYPSLTLLAVDGDPEPPAAYRESGRVLPLESNVERLDQMLGGGVDWGSSCVLIGASGTGKSSMAATYAVAAAQAGVPAAIYTFEERKETLLVRMEGLGAPVRQLEADGMLRVEGLSASQVTTGRFVDAVRRHVEAGVRVVVIDSLTGFTSACPAMSRAVSHLHDLLSHLGERGVATFLTVPQHGLLNSDADAGIDVSYIADTVLLLRHFELKGEVRKAVSVIKRRRGGHDRGVRELLMSDAGIDIGEPLAAYPGATLDRAALYGG